MNSPIKAYLHWILTFYYHYWNVFTTIPDFMLKQIFLSFMHIINVNLIVTVLRFFLSTFAYVSFSQKLSSISKFLVCVCWQFLLFSLSLLFPSQFPNILVKNVPWQIFMSNLAFKVSCILYDILIWIQILFIFKYVVQSCHILWNISNKNDFLQNFASKWASQKSSFNLKMFYCCP